MNRSTCTALAALAVSVCLALPASAGPYEDGRAAIKRRDYAAALEILRPLADRGDARGQIALGLLHQFGRGVPKDGRMAADWYRKAAEQGHVEAQYTLGRLYHNGRDLPVDDDKAAHWFGRAAGRGHVDSQFYIGLLHIDGRGVPQDFVEAHKWMSLAAGHDVIAARKFLEQLERKMTAEQVARARRLASDWKPKD